ncbi:response regulator [Paenibacillus sp. S150]|uniref:response regulator n=1 Tax=Paenibacillus sp. S150 TaxID=2749826 RepID=UPI001C576B4A|nr:response regulator [Paenibacillus sp. S150]MBW4082432.1 response regulator [Paenibacillus sp. S150]
MLRIVIVDDEVLIREGLARMISKESSRFLVTGTYADGKQLLDALPSRQIDVVITDIRMPHVDGLELIKRLKALQPQIRTLLMSGFVEFNYAREAIRSSAVDYLLKPINKEQLFEVLYRLDEERKLLREKEECQRSGLLLSLLHVGQPSAVLLSGLTLPQPYFSVFVLKGSSREAVCACSDSLRQEKELLLDSLEIRNGLYVWICYSAKPLTAGELNDIGEHLRAGSGGQRLHAGVSGSCSDPSKLRSAYLEARLACDAGIYNPQPLHYITAQEHAAANPSPGNPFAPIREPLIHDLQILNVSGVLEHIHSMFSELELQQACPEHILRACREAEDTASKELQEFGDVYRNGKGVSLEEQLAACMSFGEIEQLFIAGFSAALGEIRTRRLELSGTAVETVKRWVSANYSQHADLNMLAGMVFLTPSYLSKLFKQETGLTLTEYVIEIRIRKAKQLLKNAPDLKIHEIGAEVGYPDPAYFNKLFKKVVGVTPNEYKRISLV